ncbi:major capsid protein [Pectinatus frisingensis]|uniref:major capsid protein n=1 Tax=Pectinatus frisingensis TaxID=865 RepID=UPI002ED8EDA0
MATIGTAVTLADIKSRLDPNGLPAQIVEVLNKENQIVADTLWMEGNLPTGNVTTQRTSIPTPSVRRLNRGVLPSKSTTKQVTDTCTIFEDFNDIDEHVLSIAPNKEAERTSQDAAFTEGFREKLADMIFYGDTDIDAGEFNGLAKRFVKMSDTKGKPGYQIVSADGNASTNSSAWFVEWGAQSVCGIYPRGETGAMTTNDKGLVPKTDSEGRIMYAWRTQFYWKPGLAVKNFRKVSRLANIDITKLKTYGTSSDTSPLLMQKLVIAKNRIYQPGNVKLYVSPTVYDYCEIMLQDKKNVYITRQELMGKTPQLFFSGIPIIKCDAILETESAIA